MKIAILALANDDICVCGRCIKEQRTASYTDMVTATRRTWAAEKVEGIKVYYIYGHRMGIDFPSDSKIRDVKENSCYPDGDAPRGFGSANVIKKRHPFAIDDCIYSDTLEGRENIYYKTIDGFEWLLENEEFDYILRTTCGTYIDLQLLKEYAEKLGIRDDIYAGHMGIYNNKHNHPQPQQLKFASGSAFLVSRKLIESLVKTQRENKIDLVRSPYDAKCIGDDPTFGKYFIHDCGVDLVTWNKKDVWREDQVDFHLKNELQCYFRHTINPEMMYAVHRVKGLICKEGVSSMLKGRRV